MRIGSRLPGLFFAVLLALPCCSAMARKAPSAKEEARFSRLVHPGKDGKLVYTPDEQGNTIPDFSNAGYGGGGVKLPNVRVREVVKSGGENDAARIQAAIDRLSALSPNGSGFRGAVLLKRGRYELEKPLRITAGGVVLRGEGQDENGTVLVGLGNMAGKSYEELSTNTNLIRIEGESGPQEIRSTATEILGDYVPVGARCFHVESAEGFQAGDTVIVRRRGSMEWLREIGLDVARWQGTGVSHDSDRIILSVEGDRITVDAPLTCAIETKWGGGELVKYADTGRIREVGVENLRGMSEFDRSVRTSNYGNMDRTPYTGAEYYSDENHYWNFISMSNACNVWVRNITALHFAGSAVLISRGSKHVTVQDCISLEPVSFCGGGRRFTFQICGQLCLVQRCFSDRGRHSFVGGGLATCGPNVFLDCVATRPYGSSEPHSSLMTGTLYDNVKAPLAFRFALSNPARWMGFNNVMWNCEGMFIVQRPPTAQSYSIGHTGIHAMLFNRGLIDYTKEGGYIESLDEKVQPPGLYLIQLEDRLGREAARNTAQDGRW